MLMIEKTCMSVCLRCSLLLYNENMLDGYWILYSPMIHAYDVLEIGRLSCGWWCT